MHHARTMTRSLTGALALMLLVAPTLADGATRASEQQLPQARGNGGCSAKGKGDCDGRGRDDRGPPAGFPHTPGLDHAHDHADCHAAFQHCDSPGG